MLRAPPLIEWRLFFGPFQAASVWSAIPLRSADKTFDSSTSLGEEFWHMVFGGVRAAALHV